MLRAIVVASCSTSPCSRRLPTSRGGPSGALPRAHWTGLSATASCFSRAGWRSTPPSSSLSRRRGPGTSTSRRASRGSRRRVASAGRCSPCSLTSPRGRQPGPLPTPFWTRCRRPSPAGTDARPRHRQRPESAWRRSATSSADASRLRRAGASTKMLREGKWAQGLEVGGPPRQFSCRRWPGHTAGGSQSSRVENPCTILGFLLCTDCEKACSV
mmetsp:Transcript_81295/g.242243  ORF Transcript_81295/g.242243 Transcript_81295/m.242243 type:complete len:214 (+) Transcript_81295:1033-1674(+)